MEIFVGRQPIFDAKRRVVAYELLYRPSGTVNACTIDNQTASSVVMVNSLLDLGLDRISGGRDAFINCPEDFIVGENYLLLPAGSVVIEVLENVAPTPEVLAALGDAKANGYRIALDDFVLDEQTRAFMPHADLIKVDFLGRSREDLAAQVKEFKAYDVQLLAEKVETQEEFDMALEMGFEFFQGYFFAKPKIMRDKAIPTSQLQVLELMSALEDAEVDFGHLEQLISHDVSMSVRLLRYLNSASVGLPNKVDSIRRAIALVGLNEIRKWVRIISMANLNSNKPSALIIMSLARARMSELIANAQGRDPAQAFTLGLLSLIDAILDRPMADVLSQLTLEDEIAATLVGQQTPHSHLLQLAQQFEQGGWERIESLASAQGLDAKQLASWYVESIRYADGFFDSALRNQAAKAAA